MKNLIISLLLATSVFSSKADTSSVQIYDVNPQKIFNLAKKIFRGNNSDEFIIDTYWNSLHASKREVSYDVFSARIKKTFFQLDVNETAKGNVFNLTIYSQIEGEDKKKIPANNILYEIFWNRMDYSLGLKGWKSCLDYKTDPTRFIEGVYSLNSFLCRLHPRVLDAQSQ